MKNKIAKPFLKWAGGKTQLIGAIKSKFPFQQGDSFIYIEPFVGSGAVLFWVLNNYPNLKKAVINDSNTDLINTYKVIYNSVEKIIPLLRRWEKRYYDLSSSEEKKKEYYYFKRELFNKRISDTIIQAALFIFLNRTCFNGLYRVNKRNLFNVPVGSYKKPLICDAENLRAVSRILKKVTILNGDFERTINYGENKTCFYLDPPYKPLSATSSFTAYSKENFDDNDQIRLKKFCDNLVMLKFKWILSNSDVKAKNQENNFFDRLYKSYQVERVLAKRSINSNASKRGLLKELLITN